MKQILCFGDSNTYGLIPGTTGRYDWNVRWSGILGERMRPYGYRIVEEGLCGRTTVFEDLVKAHDIGKRINFISGLYEESDKTKKNESYVSMEVYILETISLKKEKNDFFFEMHKKDRLYSLLLSNPNLRISWDYDGDIPEGFVDFCLKNILMLNDGSYRIFQLSKKIKDYPEDVRILAAEYIEEISGSKLPKENIVKILRAYKNSVLKYGSYAFDGHSVLRYTLIYVGQFPELIKLINNQSSFALVAEAVDKNYKLLKDKEQQEQIHKSQKRIKELENLVYEDYCFYCADNTKRTNR